MTTRVREIQAKTLLAHVRQPDPWFGLRYNMNLYRGCQHRCIYCDSRSLCYGIEDFDAEVLVKANAVDLLRRELAHKRQKGTIGLGSMNDPYMPLEGQRRLTRAALEVIAEFGFGVHAVTKSDLVIRDIDVLCSIARRYATVTFTLTTADDALAAKLEPIAPRPSKRLGAMRRLHDAGLQVGVALMPVLPFLEDDPENVRQVVRLAAESGASYAIPGLGMAWSTASATTTTRASKSSSRGSGRATSGPSVAGTRALRPTSGPCSAISMKPAWSTACRPAFPRRCQAERRSCG
jgi:DNA repair photolyase